LLAATAGALAGLAAYFACGPTAGVDPATMDGAQRTLASFIRFVARPVGQVFLRCLFMLVAPLLFSALVLGVAGLSDMRSLGRLGLKTLLYTASLSTLAVLLGVTMVNVFQPGAGVSEELRTRLTEGAAARASTITANEAAKSGVDLLVQIVPDNPVKAAAAGDYLGLMFFALVFGIGLVLASGPKVERLKETLEGLYDVMMVLIGAVIRLAPFGVAALTFTLTAELGYEVLGNLARYVLVVLGALAIHQFVVYSLSVKLFGGMSPRYFFRQIQEAMVTAFSTSSSNATLPTALRVAEQKLKLPPHVSRFVLTIGSTANQNGTALFEGVTVLFLAQFYGVHLTLAQQITVVGICVLGGIGTAGVPSGSIPVIAMILGLIHVPVEGIGLILGVDRLLDMCRTVLNVSGDLAAAVVVSKGEPRPAP
jgi:DAACS family dicarboxylate/amino acid:cation (Na+ or H+) symporter